MPQPRNNSASSSRANSRSKCSQCNNLDPQGHARSTYKDTPRTRGARQPKHDVELSVSIDTLKLSRLSETGCRFCRLLAHALELFVPEWRKTRPSITLDLAYGRSVRLAIGVSSSKPRVLELFAKAGCKPPWPSLGYGVAISQNSDSDETFDFAARCLKECVSNPKHGLCRTEQTSFRPTRLLHISKPGDVIRLVEKRHFSSAVEYIALSHCWGQNLPITTESETLRKRTRGIQWDELPLLFQDAVIISHRLGVQYLWIDALCILQNDKKDWEREASAMAAVYANAYVTIAAVLATDSSHHCLGPRKPPARIKYRNTKGDEYIIKVREVSDHRPAVQLNRPALIDGPLTSRAWALQEHVLCSRVLHYTASELIFECRNMYSCECTPSLKQTSVTTPALLPKTSGKENSRRQFEAWHRLVEKYTLRELTQPSDKLPAISGMALKIQEMVDSKYLAGLWQSNILGDLLWSSSPDLQNPNQIKSLPKYRAPSFSWASVDTQICYEEHDDEHSTSQCKSVSKFLSAECITSLEYPLGEVQSGYIKLCGPILIGQLIGSKTIEFYCKLKLNSPSTIDVFPDTLLIDDGNGKIRRAKIGETYHPFKGSVICLAIKDNTSEGIISGLVLSLVDIEETEGDCPTFERLGVFHCGRDVFGQAQKTNIKII